MVWIESNGTKFRMEDKLYKELQKIKVEKLKEKDNNKIILVCGDTGSGKSAFTFQCSAVIDPNFSIKNIAFTTNQAVEYHKQLHNQVIVFDEAFRGASGRNTMGKKQKELLQMLYEIRQLNQVTFLVSPSFFRLDEAIAVELSDALFYIYKTGKGDDKRRAYRMFNKNKKNTLYYRAKKGRKAYNLVPTMFAGTFPKNYVVNEEDYRKKKFESLHEPEKQNTKQDLQIELEKKREAIMIANAIKLKGSYRSASKHLKELGIVMSLSTMHDKIAKYPEIQRFVRS